MNWCTRVLWEPALIIHSCTSSFSTIKHVGRVGIQDRVVIGLLVWVVLYLGLEVVSYLLMKSIWLTAPPSS